MKVLKNKKTVFATCKRRVGEAVVHNGLAITPSQVLKMAEQGLPVTAQLQYQMVEGHEGSDWNLGIEERRGIDMAQVWQESKSARKRLKSGAAAATPDSQNSLV